MPRGGRRPGAGAPKGNWNALRGGVHSKRMVAVSVLLNKAVLMSKDEREFLRPVFVAMRDAGIYPRGRPVENRDLPAIVDFIWNYYFDRSRAGQSNTISDNQ
jgi:hypothetical protein